ncbi:ribonuclease I [Duganella sp. Leaf126]|uniref:ribonuclease T2 family protein n=1 Tax=Duganella sp. Leaf126 TaxID=1736266 RepID=UPI0006FCA5B5|nr:ribonuclease I [Duganella sp. Leaf126]KQQ45116.1 ribonuclease I [Duganella sp. Leaf126]
MLRTSVASVTILLAFCTTAAQASEAASGTFTAAQSCEAYASFAKRTNPGGARIAAGQRYTVREINQADYQWLRVEVPGAEPGLRWVQRDCGAAILEPIEQRSKRPPRGSDPQGDGGSCNIANRQDSYVLAVTWQPGFCEHFPYKGKKPECDAMNGGKLEARTLSLHGLWPNKKECGTRYGSCEGPPFALSQDTIAKIAPWMPNFYYERTFGAYEWNKHGKCQSLAPDDYFIKAVSAVRVVNDSEVGKIILSSTGKSVRVSDFFARVKAREGEKAANSLTLVCSQRKYLQEIRVSLPLDFPTDRDLATMVGNAQPAPARVQGCGDEIYVEAAGR